MTRGLFDKLFVQRLRRGRQGTLLLSAAGHDTQPLCIIQTPFSFFFSPAEKHFASYYCSCHGVLRILAPPNRTAAYPSAPIPPPPTPCFVFVYFCVFNAFFILYWVDGIVRCLLLSIMCPAVRGALLTNKSISFTFFKGGEARCRVKLNK